MKNWLPTCWRTRVLSNIVIGPIGEASVGFESATSGHCLQPQVYSTIESLPVVSHQRAHANQQGDVFHQHGGKVILAPAWRNINRLVLPVHAVRSRGLKEGGIKCLFFVCSKHGQHVTALYGSYPINAQFLHWRFICHDDISTSRIASWTPSLQHCVSALLIFMQSSILHIQKIKAILNFKF